MSGGLRGLTESKQIIFWKPDSWLNFLACETVAAAPAVKVFQIVVIIESTYLVRPGSDIKSLSDVDRPNVRVIGIANTATIRAAGRSLKNTTIVAVKSVSEAREMLSADAVDAFALTHDALHALAARLPGSRILDGSFLQTGIAIAVPKNRPERSRLCNRIHGRREGVRHGTARV